jgi:hypothetical protein
MSITLEEQKSIQTEYVEFGPEFSQYTCTRSLCDTVHATAPVAFMHVQPASYLCSTNCRTADYVTGQPIEDGVLANVLGLNGIRHRSRVLFLLVFSFSPDTKL